MNKLLFKVLAIFTIAKVGVADLDTDIAACEVALADLEASSSGVFFRTNDLKRLLQGEIAFSLNEIQLKLADLGVSAEELTALNNQIKQSGSSLDSLLQLQLNTFRGFEQQVFATRGHLVSSQTDLPLDLDTLRKNTATCMDIYVAVDLSITSQTSSINNNILVLIAGMEGSDVDYVTTLLNNSNSELSKARIEVHNAKTVYDVRAVAGEEALALVVSQLL